MQNVQSFRLPQTPRRWSLPIIVLCATVIGCGSSSPNDPSAPEPASSSEVRSTPSPSNSVTPTAPESSPSGSSDLVERIDSTVSDQNSELNIRWEYQGDEAFESTPAIADGRVIIADVMGKVYAIDRDTGQELWKIDYDTGFLAAPVISQGSVFLGDVEGFLYCLRAADGKEVWKVETDGEINGSAALYKENVLIASQDGKLYCFDQQTGDPVWQYQTDDQIQCSPRVAGDRTFLGGCDGQLHIVDLNTGEAAGDPLPLGGPTGSTPAIAGSVAVVPIMDGIIYAFDWQQQTQIWTHEDYDRIQEYRNSPAISGDTVVVSSQFKQVDAISMKTGERLWRHTLRRRADASPVIHDGNVWIAASDGRLVRLDLNTGQPNGWEYESRGEFYAAPIIEGNELLVADDNGVVRCFSDINDG